MAYPRSDGRVERYGRAKLEALKAQNVGSDEREWDSKMGKIQWGHNDSLQKTIGPRSREVARANDVDHDIELVL